MSISATTEPIFRGYVTETTFPVPLNSVFGVDFVTAVRNRFGQWRLLDDTSGGTDLHAQPTAAELHACDKAAALNAPLLIEEEEEQPDRWLLVVPFPKGTSWSSLALAHLKSDQPEWVLRTARLWHAFASAIQKASDLRTENEYLAEQVGEDLEELTFLRSMVEHLDVSDSTNDLLTLSQTTLPLLNDTLKAESLVLLLVEDDNDPLIAAPVLNAGPQPFSNALASHMVSRFGTSALEQPVVKNRLKGTLFEALLPGVREFILVPLAVRHRTMGWLLAVNRAWEIDALPDSTWALSNLEFGTSEASLLSTTASILATHTNNQDLFREKEEILVNVVRSLVSAVEAKDDYTCGHSERVALFGRALAEEIGYDEAQCDRLYLTGLLHDVGKIGVSDAVLKKAGRLTDEEFAEIKRHPDEGWAILQELEQLRYVLPGVLYHHERYDGRGYPDGLAGEEIPIDGRLLAVVDAYDAMTSDRPYRAGMPAERAQQILREGAGTQWDANLVDVFFSALDKIEYIRQTYQLRARHQRPTGDVIR